MNLPSNPPLSLFERALEPHKNGFSSVDEYIATFPEDIQALLEEVRATVKASAPGAQERISYQMPAFALHGNLVYFAALKKHIGLYPTGSGIETFKYEISKYENTKGSVKFPINRPLPLDLISRSVRFRVTENLNKAAAKAGKEEA